MADIKFWELLPLQEIYVTEVHQLIFAEVPFAKHYCLQKNKNVTKSNKLPKNIFANLDLIINF